MLFLLTLLLSMGASAAVWAAGVSLYRSWPGAPDPRADPLFFRASALAAALTGALAFAGFPTGYVLSLIVWWLTVHNMLGLPLPRALALFAILAVLSLLPWLGLLLLLSQ
jgi:hypothetical protein